MEVKETQTAFRLATGLGLKSRCLIYNINTPHLGYS